MARKYKDYEYGRNGEYRRRHLERYEAYVEENGLPCLSIFFYSLFL